MALDKNTIVAERTLWNDIGSSANAIANMAALLVDGTFGIPYDSAYRPVMTADQKVALLARVKALRDDILAKYNSSIVKTL